MQNDRDGTMETVVGTAGVLTAGGVLTFALFPLLLPTVVLLAILALPLLPLVVLAALLAPLYLLGRGAVRLIRRRPGRQRPERADEAPARRAARPAL